MSLNGNGKIVSRPERISSYFRLELQPLFITAVSGIIYNAGMVAGPYFEGLLVQRLFNIMGGRDTPSSMLLLVFIYLGVILLVQAMRCVKRFYVRRFANDTGRNMRRMLYSSLVYMKTQQLEQEDLGTVMTKAVSDVDTCVEGMRKFTTEVFDTGVVLISYLTMLFIYDWRLALISGVFTPIAYFLAGGLKTRIARYSAEYKKSAGRLSAATMDRVSNAVTYRVYGCEQNRSEDYEKKLSDYEKCAVSANIWENSMQPIYNVIAMGGVVLVIYLGAKNVLGGGWQVWDIAAFTTFLSCFTKMALKSSKAAKLFTAVQKARVSWERIKPLMKEYAKPDTSCSIDPSKPFELCVSHLSLRLPDDAEILSDISFSARPGQIIGVTGPVACGKTALGRVFIGDFPYEGSIRISGRELSSLNEYERSRLISYMGHQPELISDSIEENIRLGLSGDIAPYLEAVCFQKEAEQMPDGTATWVGSDGVRLSGGQQARTALARTLFNARQLIILDDPFSAVDRDTEESILFNLRSLARDKIVILLSHRLYPFPSLDNVLYLDGGCGIFSTHEELLQKSPAYFALYLAQSSGGEQIEN